MIVETARFIIDTRNKFVARTGRSDFHTFYLVSTKVHDKPHVTVCHLVDKARETPAAFQKRAQLLLDILEAGHQSILAARKEAK